MRHIDMHVVYDVCVNVATSRTVHRGAQLRPEEARVLGRRASPAAHHQEVEKGSRAARHQRFAVAQNVSSSLLSSARRDIIASQ